MVQRKPETVVPLHDNKFYVYALFKPNDFNPFYIGKGIRSRINDHFKESNLKANTPKTGVIKKYGNLIKREILCYFDTEAAAYDFEEYLIGLYGLQSEDGYLVNYAKSRFEYSDKFVKEICSIGYKNRARVYSKEKINDALYHCYILKETTDVIASFTNIPENYLGYILRGKKCKEDYISFMNNYPEVALRSKEILDSVITNTRSISHSNNFENDESIRQMFTIVCNGDITLKDAAGKLDFSEKYLSEVFCGRARLYLKLDYEKYTCRRMRGKAITALKDSGKIQKMINEGVPYVEIIKILGIGRTTFYRLLKKL